MRFNVFCLIFCVVLSFSYGGRSYAQDVIESSECTMSSEYAVTLYGQVVCPDKHNQDDGYKAWNRMLGNLDELLPSANQEGVVKAPPQLCEHVKILMNRYQIDAESSAYKIGTNLQTREGSDPAVDAFLKPYENELVEGARQVDIAVNHALTSDDPEDLNSLLALFSEANQGKVLMVRKTVNRAAQLTLLYDSVLDSCPDYARYRGYYKILNYNGPDAGYDPDKDPGWTALEKKWAADRAAKEAEQQKELEDNAGEEAPTAPSQ